tara:strand:- start:369 stop:476 length:108 start_codon:yes stop_codon:yes gene_type:complete
MRGFFVSGLPFGGGRGGRGLKRVDNGEEILVMRAD